MMTYLDVHDRETAQKFIGGGGGSIEWTIAHAGAWWEFELPNTSFNEESVMKIKIGASWVLLVARGLL